jgi:hypothetical protein
LHTPAAHWRPGTIPPMQDLTLRSGPSLIARHWETDGKHEDGRWRELDVTGRAHEHLFEIVVVHASVTVGDVFRLLDASPLLQQVFRRDFAEELCAEARKRPVALAKTEQGSSVDERIEFIELYQQWSFDSSTKVYGPTQHLQLHGIGFVLEADSEAHHRSQLEVAMELKACITEINAGTGELVSGDDLFEDLDRPGCAALFDHLGSHSARELSSALQNIEDDENAAAWLEREFSGAVVVKPQFKDRNGREFRKAFRATGR